MNAALVRLLPSASIRSLSSAAASNARTSPVSVLITRLSRQGRISEARHLFDQTPQPDLTSWTALIAAYSRSGQLREAEVLFNRSDALRNVVTWTALLSGYARAGCLQAAEDLFGRMPEKNVVSWNTMVYAYVEHRMIDMAFELFDNMPVRNIVSYNTMITALGRLGRIDEACHLFFQMEDRDVVSWTAVVSGLSQNGRVDEAREFFDKMPEKNVVSWNAMISGYMLNQRIEDAMQTFNSMPEKNLASWNTVITGMLQNGDLRSARKLFDNMRERNVVTWTTLINGYVQQGQNELALKTFLEMLADQIRPNENTFATILASIGCVAARIEGLQIHQVIRKTKFQFSPYVESALMSMYSKCGDIEAARKLFDFANHHDLVNWNGMVAAYAHHGFGEDAIQLFEEMCGRGLQPNDVTYIAVLSACSHSGLVEAGLKLFDSLMKDGSIELRDGHYSCLVDLCSRAGRLDDIGDFILRQGIESLSEFSWSAFLGGCNFYKNVNFGKLVASKIIKANPYNSGAYLLMSNFYASTDRWKEAAEIRSKMTDRGLKKQPGCSWIEIGCKIHVFLARDRFHVKFDSIDSMLQKLHHEMNMVGYASTNQDVNYNDE